MTEQKLEGHGIVSASIPLPHLIWFIEECNRLGMSRSAFLAKLIAEERKRQDAISNSTTES